MSGNGGSSHGEVCSVLKSLETSPSKSMTSSSLTGTKGNLSPGKGKRTGPGTKMGVGKAGKKNSAMKSDM